MDICSLTVKTLTIGEDEVKQKPDTHKNLSAFEEMSAYNFDRVVEECLKDKRMSKKNGGKVVTSAETRVRAQQLTACVAAGGKWRAQGDLRTSSFGAAVNQR